MKQVRAALGCLILQPATDFEDTKEATDLRVFDAKDVRIAVRIRRDKYRERYGHEITLRNTRPSGTPSETAKIISGWGHYLFYGFATDSGQLTQYVIINLNGVREWLWNSKEALAIFYQTNTDASSDFIAIPISDLPEWCITKRWQRVADNNQSLGQVSGRKERVAA